LDGLGLEVVGYLLIHHLGTHKRIISNLWCKNSKMIQSPQIYFIKICQSSQILILEYSQSPQISLSDAGSLLALAPNLCLNDKDGPFAVSKRAVPMLSMS